MYLSVEEVKDESCSQWPKMTPSVDSEHRSAAHTPVSQPPFHCSIQSSGYLLIPAHIDLVLFIQAVYRVSIPSCCAGSINSAVTAHKVSDISHFGVWIKASGKMNIYTDSNPTPWRHFRGPHSDRRSVDPLGSAPRDESEARGGKNSDFTQNKESNE